MSYYQETVTLGGIPMQTDGGSMDYVLPTTESGRSTPVAPISRTPREVAASASTAASASATASNPKTDTATPNIAEKGTKSEGENPSDGGAKGAIKKYLPYAIGFGLIYFLFLRKK